MALGGGEVERGVEAAEGGVARERGAELQQHPRLDGVPVARRRDEPLAGGRATQRVAHRRRPARQARPPPQPTWRAGRERTPPPPPAPVSARRRRRALL